MAQEGMPERSSVGAGGPLVIGIAGGSGSGKTSIASAVVERVGPENVSEIAHDSYYRDLSELSFEDRKKFNFDHPDSLETELLIEHLRRLKNGESIGVPVYDFKTHSRWVNQSKIVHPRAVLIVDGILLFSDAGLRDLIDIKIFIDTDADIRFIRRLRRDTKERGRTSEEVAEQYLATVRPMHIQFVEPTKRFADIVIPEGGYEATIAMDMLISYMKSKCAPTIDKIVNERQQQQNELLHKGMNGKTPPTTDIL